MIPNLRPEHLVGIPGIGETEGLDAQNIEVKIKLFTPDSCFTWFVTEFDPETQDCYGLVCGFEKEFGYFSLAELHDVTGPMGLSVERDAWWTSRSLKDLLFQEGML
ncbi:MAG: DUF2958 domain-containing protein [Patescibacteria group bacterium]